MECRGCCQARQNLCGRCVPAPAGDCPICRRHSCHTAADRGAHAHATHRHAHWPSRFKHCCCPQSMPRLACVPRLPRPHPPCLCFLWQLRAANGRRSCRPQHRHTAQCHPAPSARECRCCPGPAVQHAAAASQDPGRHGRRPCRRSRCCCCSRKPCAAPA